ncbi:MAG: MASE1 domain-containing protein [Hyphomicrobium sp.]|uniref:MASE1 domain-containing protein n=1 Tax=Hyphomicrobium sp. TaxID=82 RepID=UPI0039E3B597
MLQALARNSTGEMPTLRYLALGFIYLAVYVALDWLSFVDPLGAFGITPWNPTTGVSIALVLAFGRAFIPWLFIAPLLADGLLRQFPLPIDAEIAVVATLGFTYTAATWILTRADVNVAHGLQSKRDLIWLLGTAAVAALVAAVSCVLLLALLSIIHVDQIPRGILEWWVGDMIGITVMTPFLLFMLSGRRIFPQSAELMLPFALMLGAFMLIFGSAGSNRPELFYLLFLPIIWIAIRFGLEAVTGALVVTQVLLIAAIQVSGHSDLSITSLQILMLILALTGLTVGMLVSEQRNTQRELWLHREALGRASRVGSLGALAAAIAHEINQPLTAIGNYARVGRQALKRDPADHAAAARASEQVIEQVDRAAAVIRWLRDFIGAGTSRFEVVSVSELIRRPESVCRAELEEHGIRLETIVSRDLPNVNVDRLQIEQVITNIVKNAAEAISGAGGIDGRIRIEAGSEGDMFIAISITDNGPGFDPILLERPISPFTTTKSGGMGLGLSLSQSIIEFSRWSNDAG